MGRTFTGTLVAIAAFTWGCGGGASSGGGNDAAPDPVAEAGADGPTDAAPDVAPEAVAEVVPDAAPDPAADTAMDTTADTGADPGTDPGVDTTADPGADNPAELAADVPPDVPAGCCLIDSQCADGKVCVVFGPADAGVCMEPATGTPWACWRDADCAAGGVVCKGVIVGTCSHPSSAAPEPGTCTAAGCCVDDAGCDAGARCEEPIAACLPVPADGQCWTDEDCDGAEQCFSAYLCPCSSGTSHACVDCDAECAGDDRTGTCIDLKAAGCCQTDTDCGPGLECAPGLGGGTGLEGWGICITATGQGRCWDDADCGPGGECHGAAVCGCLMDCDMAWEGPGVCTQPGDACTVVHESWLEDACDFASAVVYDGIRCVRAAPGRCGCFGFCDLTFDDVATCDELCQPQCRSFGGECLDAIPPEPWWYFADGACGMEDACIGVGPGVYPSELACRTACLPDCHEWTGLVLDDSPPKPLWVFDGYGCVEKTSSWPQGEGVYDSQPACRAACGLPGASSCGSHYDCPAGQLCLKDATVIGYAAVECGMCGDIGSCHCADPGWTAAHQCATEADCPLHLPCGDGCDDCPECPPCTHGWCAYDTFAEPLCMCTGCA